MVQTNSGGGPGVDTGLDKVIGSTAEVGGGVVVAAGWGLDVAVSVGLGLGSDRAQAMPAISNDLDTTNGDHWFMGVLSTAAFHSKARHFASCGLTGSNKRARTR